MDIIVDPNLDDEDFKSFILDQVHPRLAPSMKEQILEFCINSRNGIATEGDYVVILRGLGAGVALQMGLTPSTYQNLKYLIL